MPKLSASDWMLRGAVALVFFLIGMEKLTGTTWVKLFEEIGFGEWFRYFTGGVQMTGSALLLICAYRKSYSGAGGGRRIPANHTFGLSSPGTIEKHEKSTLRIANKGVLSC